MNKKPETSDSTPMHIPEPEKVIPTLNEEIEPETEPGTPAMIKILSDYYQTTAQYKNKQFATQMALTLCSAILGRGYCTDDDNTSKLFCLQVAKAGYGKEHIRTCISKLLVKANLYGLLSGPRGHSADTSVMYALSKRVSHVTIIDEFGSYLLAAKSNGMAHKKSAIVLLMIAYSDALDILEANEHSPIGKSHSELQILKKQIIEPCIILLGMSTPGIFSQACGIPEIESGFVSRFCIIFNDGPKPLKNKSRVKAPVPPEFLAWAKKYGGHHKAARWNKIPNKSEIPISNGALKRAYNYELEIIKLENKLPESYQLLYARSLEKSQKIALIAALCNSHNEVTENDMKWAIDYVRKLDEGTVKFFVPAKKDEAVVIKSSYSEQVLDFIEKGGDRGETKSTITIKFPKVKPMFETFMEEMMKEFPISMGDTSVGKALKPRIAYILNQDKT